MTPNPNIKEIRKAIVDGGVLLLDYGVAGGEAYLYKDGYMFFIKLDPAGAIKSAATMNDRKFDMLMNSFTEPPTKSQVIQIPGDLAAQVEAKISGDIDRCTELWKDKKMSVGGGLTTDQAFEVAINLSEAHKMMKKVLDPDSNWYFTFK